MSPYRQSAAPVVPASPSGFGARLRRIFRNTRRSFQVAVGRVIYGRLTRPRHFCGLVALRPIRTRFRGKVHHFCVDCQVQLMLEYLPRSSSFLDNITIGPDKDK